MTPYVLLTCCRGSTLAVSVSVHSPGSSGCQRRPHQGRASYSVSSVPIATPQRTTRGKRKKSYNIITSQLIVPMLNVVASLLVLLQMSSN